MWLKNSKATVIWLATVFFVGVATAASSPLEAQCASLAQSLQLENTSVWFTQYVTTGTNLTFPDNDPTCNRRSQAVSADICRVALLVKTSDRSNISMEAWLPSNWTGRFLSTGNGGLSGCMFERFHSWDWRVLWGVKSHGGLQAFSTRIWLIHQAWALRLLAQIPYESLK